MRNLSDELVKKAVAGDGSAIHTIVSELQQPFYNLALKLLMNPADAEEATQEALLRVVTRLSSFDGLSKLSTWAWRVAIRCILNFRDGARRAPMLTFDNFADDLQDGLQDNAPTPDDALLLQQVKIGCGRALLQCLDGEHRVAYVLGEVLEFTGTEASKILEIDAQTFRKRLSRARSRVSEHLESHCGVVNPKAPCSCKGRVKRAQELGRLNPNDRLGDLDLERLSHTVREVSLLARGGVYFRADPEQNAPAGLLQRIENAVGLVG